MLARSGVERRAVRIARLRETDDVGAAAEAGVGEVLRNESVQRASIKIGPFALPHDRPREAHAEPVEIAEHRRLMAKVAAAPVEVFDPQKQPPASFAGDFFVAERRIGVAKMERSVRRGRKA